MASAFYALRANELLFSKLVERYLLGEPVEPRPLDAWLADPTRMPARMHSEYLRQLFLENRFAHGNYEVGGRAVALKDIRTPIFALGAERDHIAPWRSVYKIELFSSAESTFVLTGGGHNSSVVSPPGKPGAYYWMSRSAAGSDFIDPDVWLATAPRQSGSWWPEWGAWLRARSAKEQIKARRPLRAGSNHPTLGAAPGSYVHDR
jgi:polyhydroxyalkanoate synthase